MRVRQYRRYMNITVCGLRVAGDRDTDIAVADVAVIDRENMFGRIVVTDHGDAVEDQRIAGIGRRIEHDRPPPTLYCQVPLIDRRAHFPSASCD